jgi:photosystem II stability/assembly factor-like uncharacterized protein
MRRMLAVMCAAALLALPTVGDAAEPSGYALLGPPASLKAIVFASDGTEYGTADRATDYVRFDQPGALWRSTDHGRTWSAAYRPPGRKAVAVLAASPEAAYVRELVPGGSASVERIDLPSGRVVQLPLGDSIGLDAAGTAYGLSYDQQAVSILTRCRPAADSCDQIPLAVRLTLRLAVDVSSPGVLASTAQTPTGTFVMTSTDGGASWTQGAPLPYNCPCPMAFAGPAPRTLTIIAGSDFTVSHDAGLSLDVRRPLFPSGYGAFIVGSHPVAALPLDGVRTLITTDEGATLRPVDLPSDRLTVDPTDGRHILAALRDGWMTQSWDEGVSWSDVADARFGALALDPNKTSGSGTHVYAYGPAGFIWHSGDLGATWTNTPAPPDAIYGTGFAVSRDDPRVAYTVGDSRGSLRTLDGGQHWQPLAGIGQIVWVQPGDAAHIVKYIERTSYESHDAGDTWTPLAADLPCLLALLDATHLGCAGATAPLPQPPPAIAFGIRGSPDAPGAYAVASGKLLGNVGPDWSFSSSLAMTGAFGPPPELASGQAVWPARGGTTFYGFDGTQSVTWVRRGSGRWWHLQESGQKLTLITPLDSTHALVWAAQSATPAAPAVALVDLAHPVVAPPVVQAQGARLTCAVPWTAADAETSAYAWLRDGVQLRDASAAQYAPSPLDAGHDLTCRATARTDFGSTTIVSPTAYRVPGSPVPALRLTGTAAAGLVLRCGAKFRLGWLRDGHLLQGRHTRGYLVRTTDEGHALACQTRRSNGTLERSLAVRVPRSRGGRAS